MTAYLSVAVSLFAGCFARYEGVDSKKFNIFSSKNNKTLLTCTLEM